MIQRPHSRMKRFLYHFSLALLLLVLLSDSRSVSSNGCPGCKRRWGLVEFINIHAPDIEERRRAWRECIIQNLPPGYQTFDQNDPLYQEALKKCEHLEVGDVQHMLKSSVQTRIAEVFKNDSCFSLALDPLDYFFEGSFEVLKDQEYIRDGERMIPSRMILNLFYNGDTKEIVESWQTETTNDHAESHWGPMFKNPDAALRRSIPIIELLQNFEKRPQSCSIEEGKDELGPMEEIEIRIDDFKDEKGNDSREFNRILVEAEKGSILNGVPSQADRNKKVFKVGGGTVTIQYRAPDSCDAGEDILTVYNSCDIVGENQLPLSQTRVDSEIETKEIRVVCYEAILTKKTSFRYVPSAYSSDTREIEVTLRLQLEPFENASTLLKIKKYEVESFSGIITYEHGGATNRQKDVWNLSSVTPFKLTFSSNTINLVRDKATGKVTKAIIPIYVVNLEWSGSDEIEPPGTLTIGPVSEQKDIRVPENRENPAAMMQFITNSLNKDLDVTRGDGLNLFGGEARIETSSPEGDMTEVESFRWEIRKK